MWATTLGARERGPGNSRLSLTFTRGFSAGSPSSRAWPLWLPFPPEGHARLDAEHYLLRDLPRLPYPTKKLREVVEIVRVKVRKEALPDPVRYVEISDLDPNIPLILSHKTLEGGRLPSRASFLLREGDLITAVSGGATGTEGHVSALVTSREEGYLCTNGFAVLRNPKGVDPYYLLAFLRSPLFLRQVRARLRGHAIPSLSLEDLGEVEVPLLPPEEREAVARRMREAVQELLEAFGLLRGMKKAFPSFYLDPSDHGP